MKYIIFTLSFLSLLSACQKPQEKQKSGESNIIRKSKEEIRDFGKYFEAEGLIGCFVLYDLKKERFVRYNPKRCSVRFSPASTFKIPNSLIGLETGVIPDENLVLKWDGEKRWVPAWNQNQDLKAAIKNSTVWYYQELARLVGEERMKKFVTAFEYGNQDISGGIDQFWLNGTLRISPDEQITFLRKLQASKLPVSQRSLDIVKKIIVLEETPTYVLRGKTGWHKTDERSVGWLVGWVEKGEEVYFYVLNTEAPEPLRETFAQARHTILRGILHELDVLPEQALQNDAKK